MQRERISVSLHDQRPMKLKKAHHKSLHHFRSLKHDHKNETEAIINWWIARKNDLHWANSAQENKSSAR